MAGEGMKDGGPAFPEMWKEQTIYPGGYKETLVPQHGMSLRDWFAGQWLAGRSARECIESWEDAAQCAYGMADAMLAQREK